MNSQDYIDKLGIVPSECSCESCKRICHAPCCGSVEDFEKIIDSGYADRLMLDDLPDISNCGPILKPALKGHEGCQAPWEVRSSDGCTFWNKDRKCDLHDKGLKPIQGRISYHSAENYDLSLFAEINKSDWESERGVALIEKWKKLVKYDET